MSRSAFLALLVFGWLGVSAPAQEIKVVRKPPGSIEPCQSVVYDEWSVSYSRKNGPTVFEFDSTQKTEKDARKRAQKLIDWSNEMAPNSDWRLAVILIEGEPSIKTRPGPEDRRVDEVYVCGDGQVRAYEIDGGDARETWRWTAAEAEDLPAIYRERLFRSIDECKSVDDGRSVLVTSSSDGVVLIDRATRAVRFRARSPMAHSAEVLPGGRLAVALSTHKDGNRLEVYDRSKNEAPLFHLDLFSGHGAVWDADRDRLFALSFDKIQAFSRKDWDGPSPGLVETGRWTLPGKQGGHDLTRDPKTRKYLVTTTDAVWWFDPDATAETGASAFTPYPPLDPAPDVKSIELSSRRAVWVKAEESWWAFGFTVADRDGKNRRRIEVPGLHLYKVRWAAP